MKVLVAGAGGHLGRELVRELEARGHDVHALLRKDVDVSVAPLDEVVGGVDAVFSALGGTSRFDRGPRTPFAELDTLPNLRLLEAAERAGVGRFAYVSVLNGDRFPRNAYAKAHEDVVDAVRASAIAHTIIRANGFFSAYDELLDLARKGRARILGDPDARSNPVHDADLATACVDALENGESERAVGGPETMTRREEYELVYAAAGSPDKNVGRVPTPLARAAAKAMRPVNPRRAAVLDFILDVSSIDMIGPPHGERTLREYLM